MHACMSRLCPRGLDRWALTPRQVPEVGLALVALFLAKNVSCVKFLDDRSSPSASADLSTG